MEKLSENGERVWKVLSHYPKGTIYKEIMRVTGKSKNYVYNALKELESKGFVEHKQPFWILKGIIKEKPSTEEPSKFDFHNTLVSQFWKERDLAEEYRLQFKVSASWSRTKSFARLLPNSPKKDDVIMFIEQIDERKGYTLADRLQFLYNRIPEVWSKIASILSEP